MADGVGVSTAEVGPDAAAVGCGTGDDDALLSTGTDGVPAEVEEEGKGAVAPLEGLPAVITVEGEEEARGEDKEEAEAEAEAEEEDEGVKWLGLYSSAQTILIVGDGDFSFSLALATGFGSGANVVATSLDTYEVLKRKYSKAESNIMELKRLGATVLHGVDVKEKQMRLHTDLKNGRFDRIVFNFPHGGFKGKEDDLHMIKLHKDLVREFFSNAFHLVRQLGEVHVTHKIGEPYDSWDLEQLASKSSLVRVGKVPFRKEDYPGYNQKRGDSKRSDEPFDLGACCTFKFQIGNCKEVNRKIRKKSGLIPNLGGSNFHPGHWVSDRWAFHPVAPVEAWPGHHFAPPAHTGRMLMPQQPYNMDQWQQPSFPLTSDGMVGGPYLHKQESRHPMVSIPGKWLNDLPAQGGVPPPLPVSVPPPLPMGRIPFPDLHTPQEQPWYQQRTIPDQVGDDTYFFAREYQMSLQREYEMQRQVIPGATSLTHSAFLERRHRDRESVEKLERLHRMIALYGRK